MQNPSGRLQQLNNGLGFSEYESGLTSNWLKYRTQQLRTVGFTVLRYLTNRGVLIIKLKLGF